MVGLAVSLIVSLPWGFAGYALTFSLLPPGGITDHVRGFLIAGGGCFLLMISVICVLELGEAFKPERLREFEERVRRSEELLHRRPL